MSYSIAHILSRYRSDTDKLGMVVRSEMLHLRNEVFKVHPDHMMTECRQDYISRQNNQADLVCKNPKAQFIGSDTKNSQALPF